MILKVIPAIISAIIVFINQLRVEKQFRNTGLIFAAFLIFFTAIFTIYDHYSSKKSENERIADLQLIQTMASSVQDLAFELKLKDNDPSKWPDLDFQISTIIYTRYSTSGMFADYYNIYYSSDSGWRGTSHSFHKYKNIECNYDSSANIVRFAINNFGASCDHGSRTCWEPQNIADLGKVSFELLTGPLDPHKNIDGRLFRKICPIEYVSIYSNNYTSDNLLVVANKKLNKEKDNGSAMCVLMPKSDAFYNTLYSTRFKIDPVNIRSAIVNSLE